MTLRQFYEWQTAGGSTDVTRLVEAHRELRAHLPAELISRLDL